MHDPESDHRQPVPAAPVGRHQRSLFTCSGWTRILLALAGASVAMAIAIAAESVPLAGDSRVPPDGRSRLSGQLHHLTITSTFDVAHWTVTCQGRDISPEHVDADRWSGMTGPGEVFVTAIPAAPDDAHLHALQVVGDVPGGEWSSWGIGAMTVVIPRGP